MPADVELTLWLEPRRRESFTSARAAAIGAQPIAARTYLSRTQLRVDGDAGEPVYRALENHLRAAGLSQIGRDWRRVTAAGSVSLCRAALASLNGTPLASEVVAVFGLDETAPVVSYARRGRPGTVGVTPLEVARAYRLPPGLRGTGTTIGIVYFNGDYHASDLEAAMLEAKRPMPSVASVGLTNDACGNSLRDESDHEIALDTQVVARVAPGARIVLYRGENDARGYAAAFARALLDDEHAPSVVSISYGVAETYWPAQALRALDNLFIAAALCGISVVAASGDSGSEIIEREPQAEFPASSAFVLACGGTTLRLERGSRLSEIVWNEAGSSSGGGYSRHFERPPWQDAGTSWRGVPDVAGHAATSRGYRIHLAGEVLGIGGTSAVAPLWAAFIGLVNERLRSSCGLITPLLYERGDSNFFYDVTTGGTGRYHARAGWDPCTGLGAPNFAGLLKLLAE